MLLIGGIAMECVFVSAKEMVYLLFHDNHDHLHLLQYSHFTETYSWHFLLEYVPEDS